jgi:glycosyltransferase involved in cell wall biosynthesis
VPAGEPVEVLLATYQGARFLEQQLESLLAQTHANWSAIARDDGSTDATPEILARYAARHPQRFRILPGNGQRLGAAQNFATLIVASRAPRVMFCDQDDVWLPEKIEVTLAAMADLEGRRGASCPALVFTDLRVVDEGLAPLGDSLWRYQGTDPERLSRLPRALLQNCVTGSTAMVNRPLIELSVPIPVQARMHDWWLALVAISFGAIAPVRRPTVLYRQHGRNDRGAARFSFLREAARALDRESWRRTSETRAAEIRRQEDQAATFLARYRDRLSERDRATVAAFATLSRQGYLTRRARMLRHGFFYSNPLATAAMLLLR